MKFFSKLVGAPRRLMNKAKSIVIVDRRKLHIFLENQSLRKLFETIEVEVLLDVGANAGQYGKATRSAGYSGRLISFEPLPDLARSMKYEARNDHSWEIRNEAVIPTHQESIKFKRMKSSQMSSFKPPKESSVEAVNEINQVIEEIEVKTTTLPAVLSELGSTSKIMLKLDTQGLDGELLRANEGLLERFSVIQVELSFEAIYEGSDDWKMVVDLLEKQGFFIAAIFPNNAGHFPRLIEQDALFVNERLISASPICDLK